MARLVTRCAWLPACLAALLAGCSALSHSNRPIDASAPADERATRATFRVDGNRGNPRVLFFLALSGGGSRAAYLSASSMLKLQRVFDDVDLLAEVDVISSVSGGSMPAAYYAVSRDESQPPAGPLARLRVWNERTVRELMTRNYLLRWFGNWFWPNNIFLYWFTAHDRSDIMAKTFEDNLYDTPILGVPLTFQDLNPQRPYLIINSTNATEQNHLDEHVPDDFAFGSVFTFTHEDFRDRLQSDIQQFPVASAVMASSAFPLVFQNVTLGDFRPTRLEHCRNAGAAAPADLRCRPLYVHVFDGGNSDNLGLRSIKRALFSLVLEGKLDPASDKVVVLLVDAFTKPLGASRSAYDPRSLLSLIVDFNVVDAIDSLLQANRAHNVGEFQTSLLRWNEGDCARESQNLPPAMCQALDARFGSAGSLDLRQSLVFYHFGFDDVGDPALKGKLDRIPTSFNLSDEEAGYIDQAVEQVLNADNPCLQQIRRVFRDEAGAVGEARAACGRFDKLPQMPAGR